jgi:septum site-determining protein MinD
MIPAAQTRDKTAVNPTQMTKLVGELRKEFDFILIDSPAGIEAGFKNAVAPADHVIIVTTPEVSAVRDADRIIGLVEAAEKPAPQLIINRLRPSMVKRGEMMDTADVLEVLAIELIGIVPEDESIITSTNRGQPVAFEEKTPAGAAYGRIAQRLLGKDVPFGVFEESTNVFQRMSRWFRGDHRGQQ